MRGASRGGKDFIYRVTTGGATYTLCLTKTPDRRWPVSEFKGVCSCSAPFRVTQEVHRWLAANNAITIATQEPPKVATTNPPPIAGTTVDGLTITPLTQRTALTAHGMVLSAYTQRINLGRAWVYQVTTLPCVTLAVIGCGRGGVWKLEKVRSEGGLPVGGELLIILARWLDRAQGRYR